MIQMPQLLYLIAEQADGSHSVDEIADTVTKQFGRGLSGEQVQYLVDEKLRPLGVLAAADGSSPQLAKADPMLALKFRAALVPAGVVRAITTVFQPLFLPLVVVAVLGTLAVLDVWLFGIHGVAQGTRQVLYQPAWLLVTLGLVILSAAFHECGHATACRYGGASPGVMGAGVYLVWPAFYTDVTDAYRLGKVGRLRTDLGGVYFNAIFILGTAAAYFITGYEPLLLVILLQHLEILHQFLPFVRLDGYYILSDLTGVPDMFSRIKPTLKSLLPWRKTEDAVAELKPWVRAAVSVYVLALIPIMLGTVFLMLISAPRIFATTWDSMFIQWDKVSAAFDNGNVLSAFAGSVQIVALLLPVGGMSAAFLNIGKRIGLAAWQRTEGSGPGRAAVVLSGAAIVAVAGFILWPNGEYRPIQPGEKGTVQGGLEQAAAIPTGRPSLTKERERELGGAPTRRSQLAGDEEGDPADADETTTTETPTTATGETQTQPGATTPTTTSPTQTATTPTETGNTPTSTTPTGTTTTPTTTTPTTTTTTPTSTTPQPPPGP